jgi:hypothetical protein
MSNRCSGYSFKHVKLYALCTLPINLLAASTRESVTNFDIKTELSSTWNFVYVQSESTVLMVYRNCKRGVFS